MMKRVMIPVLILFAVAQSAFAQATFHGDNARTGVYASAGPKVLKGIKWAFKTNGFVVSSPAIAEGVVYIGSADNYLYAVDQQTGQQKWRYKTGGPIASSPAVANATVYFISYDGTFYALAAATGVLKWKFSTDAPERRFEAKNLHGAKPKVQTIPDPWDFYTSSPAVFNGRVYFGSGDGNIYALDAQTGALQWKYTTGGLVHASPAIANNTLYIGSWDSYLYALNADTGALKWKFKTGEDPVIHNQQGFQSSPAVVDAVVYVGCRDGHLYAVDATTGRRKWDRDTKGAWVSATPAVRDGVVYIGTGSSLQFLSLDAQTGRERFTFDMKVGVFSSAALAGEMAYVGNFNGRLYAFDMKSGKVVWQFQTESSKADPMKVLTPDGAWKQEGFAATFHDFQDMYINMYRRFSVGAILSSPVIDHGEIYFGSTDGFLYALQ